MKTVLYRLESKDSLFGFKGLKALLRLLDDYDKRIQGSRHRVEFKGIKGSLFISEM
jgi:hypothetical protein